MDQNERGPKEPIQPSHIAYHVREGTDKPYFNRIGSAFEHRDGKGFNILLDSVPVDGKVTLRTNEERLRAAREDRAEDRAGDRSARSRDRGR